MERKRRVWGWLAVCVVVSFGPSAWGQFGGGGGRASDPYLIYTAEHLRAMRNYRGKPGDPVYYKFMADIDLQKELMWPLGTAGAPFMGVVDGNGKTISNLKIVFTSGENFGLFGYAAQAEFRDLGLIDVEISAPGGRAVGALAGTAAGGKVERCYVKGGTVSGQDEVGGLIGNASASILQCYASCSVSGQDSAGGLVGMYVGHTGVCQCYSTATVSGDGSVGGLIGRNQGFVRDCYATGAIEGNSSVGGLVGSGGLICNCYAAGPIRGKWYFGGLAGGASVCCSSFWDTRVSGPTSVSNGVGKTTGELCLHTTFRGWGRGTAWTIDERRDYPRLAWENRPGVPLQTRAFPESQGEGTAQQPYLIRTAEEFNAIGNFAAEWDRHYRLESDIDMALLDEPIRIIGRDEATFTGVFDGNGHSISNFTYPFLDTCVGLFGTAERAVIKRLTLINPRLEQDAGSRLGGIGPLVGVQLEGIVEACGVEGGAVSAGRKLGGLVGICYSGTIRQCYSTCRLRGWMDAEDIGGLLGVGYRCNVNNCYAQGEVRGLKNLGGLIGQMDQGNVSHCYAAGWVSSGTNTGGLIGLATKTVATACFWDPEATGQTKSMAGTGAPTAELQKAATFLNAGWDFAGERQNGPADIWSIDEGRDYPRFTPEPAVAPVRIWVDDFEDGESAPLWQVYEPTPESARLREVNGRLELQAPAAPVDKSSAAFLANGWALDPSQDFNLRVDFHFTASRAGQAWVSFGLTPDGTTPPGRRMELTAGCLENEPIHMGNRADGLGFATWWTARGCDNGVLYLSYDAALDELYLSYTGYGPANAWRAVTGLLKDRWAGRPLYVILGGGSEGMKVETDEAWLDNFALDAGTVLQ